MAFGPKMQFTVGELTIELAPITKDVLGEFAEGMSRVPVIQYLGRTSGLTLEDEQEWYDKTRADSTSLVWGIWLVEGDTRTVIGNSALTHISNGHIRQAISGSMIFREEYWGKGIASAAHKARTWYAFQRLGLHRIQSAVIWGNGGSRKALERSGYELVYVERNTAFIDGALRHQDNLACINPQEPFWQQWWHGDRPTRRALEAKKRTLEALAWVEQEIRL